MKYIKAIVSVTLAAIIGLYLFNRFLPSLALKIGLTGTSTNTNA